MEGQPPSRASGARRGIVRGPHRHHAGPLAPGLIIGRGGSRRTGFDIGFPRGPQRPTLACDDIGELLTYEGDGHICTFAATGTGKTSGPAVQNALNHAGQLIALDMKGSLHAITARRRREMGQRVHALDLRDLASSFDSLNPFDMLARTGTEPAAIARSLAAQLIERSTGERDRYWNDNAETQLTGWGSHLLADRPPEERRLSVIYDALTQDDPVYALAALLDSGRVKDRAARAAFASFLSLPDRETRPCVLSSTLQHLRLWDSALVRRLTDTTTIDLDALVAGEPMTIYLIAPPVRLTAFAPLLRIWISGLLALLAGRTRLPHYRTLVLADEIAALGPMDAFLTASTLMRGWGITLWSFWQSIAQLDIYGTQARTIVDNAGVIQVFGVRNRRAAQEFANLVGGADADTVLGLGRDEQLLLVEGAAPRRARRTAYFDDPLFARGAYDPDPLAPPYGQGA